MKNVAKLTGCQAPCTYTEYRIRPDTEKVVSMLRFITPPVLCIWDKLSSICKFAWEVYEVMLIETTFSLCIIVQTMYLKPTSFPVPFAKKIKCDAYKNFAWSAAEDWLLEVEWTFIYNLFKFKEAFQRMSFFCTFSIKWHRPHSPHPVLDTCEVTFACQCLCKA